MQHKTEYRRSRDVRAKFSRTQHSSSSEKRREQSSAVALMLRLRALQSTCFHFWTMSTFMPILDRIFYLYHFSDTLGLWNIISVKLYLWSKSFRIFENILKTQNDMRSKRAGTKLRSESVTRRYFWKLLVLTENKECLFLEKKMLSSISRLSQVAILSD